MAKIEMDLSEFKIMEENKKLLQDSLDRERNLQKQIETLNLEKIKALEDAKMKVVKITKQENRKYLAKIDETVLRNGIRSLSNRGLSRSEEDCLYSKLEPYFERAFKTFESISFPVEETTLVGLDEVKGEIRKNLQEEMKEDIKSANENSARFEEVAQKCNILRKENEQLLEQNRNSATDIEKFTKEIELHKITLDFLAKRLDKIAKVLGNTSGWFKNYRKLTEISQILVSSPDKL